MGKEKISLSQLERFLLEAADILRGKMDASEPFLVFRTRFRECSLELHKILSISF